ncbi:MAG: hypothetical protein NC080_10460, partial [Paraprevotella sp.]|nr:hypothetical protein [Paraprevotella sp.]
VLLPVWSCHSSLCLRQNGRNTNEHKGKTDWKSNERFGFNIELVGDEFFSLPHKSLSGIFPVSRIFDCQQQMATELRSLQYAGI